MFIRIYFTYLAEACIHYLSKFRQICFHNLMVCSCIWIWNFVAVWQSIGDWVVEQAVLAITPWEGLPADKHVLVRNEFRTRMFRMLNMTQVCVQHAQTDGWETDEKCHTSPEHHSG